MSSYLKVKKIPVAPNQPRNFVQTYGSETANKTVDLLQEFLVLGLDLYIRNRGASALTVSVDKGTAITVDAGDTFVWENVVYSLVEVKSTVTYDLVVAGIQLTKGMIDHAAKMF